MRSNHGVNIAIASGLALGAFGAVPALAQEVIDGGQTVSVPGTQVSPWNIGNTLTVGSSGEGTLDITSGGTVTNTEGQVGVNDGSSGTVTVTGPNASWTNNGNLFLGYGGEGTLTIANGGTVDSTLSTFIGRSATGVGTVTVTGAGSTLTSTPGGVFIGYGGRGTLNILDGGAVISRPSTIGESTTGSGEVLVSGAGSTWTIDVVSTTSLGLAIGNQGSGLLTINDGGATNVGSVAHIGSVAGASGTLIVDGGSWTDQGLYVGQYGQGTMEVTGGGTVDSYYGHIGRQLGSTGTVTVSGAGSTWTTHTSATSVGLYIGNQGTGTLAVSSGGAVSTADVHIGSAASGSGTLTVGTGGSFGSGRTYVGHTGTGVLTISGGGAVSNTGVGYVGYASGSSGTVTVTDAGSRWANSSSLYVGNSGAGVLTINGGGAVSNAAGIIGNASGTSGTVTVAGAGSSWASSGILYVGSSGTGALTISGGGAVSNTYGRIGSASGSSGTVTVTGAGSTWTNSSAISVGQNGTGALTISGGGAVSNYTGAIGDASGSSGTLTVTDAGSSLTTGGYLYVGHTGTGTLTINGGGTVSSTYGRIGYASGSSGTATVTGAGSSWTTGSFNVGHTGTGALTISGGGAVGSGTSHIGSSAGSLGTATLTGSGSHWTISSSLTVGNSGEGRLSILSGATATNTSGTIGNASGALGTVTVDNARWINSGIVNVGQVGTGALTISGGGAVSNAAGYIGYSSGSSGAVTVTDAGSNWTSSGDLYVGRGGTGALTISGGGAVGNTAGYIGYASGSAGTVTVSDAGSRWTSSSGLYVGSTGTGALTISGGGAVGNTAGYIGYASGSSGTVTVTDTGSSWTSSGQLQIGRGDDGALSILNGATVSSVGGGFVGVDDTGTGTVTVHGSGSVWTSSNNILVGYNGTGTLTVSGGGLVENPNGFIAAYAGSTGAATVTGPGSIWSNTNTLRLGYQGTGTLSIVDSGRVTAPGGVTVAEISGSTGTLEVASGGLLETFALSAGSGAAQVTFNGGKLLALGDNMAFITGFASGALDIATDGLTLDTAGYTVATDQSGFSGAGAFTKSGSGTLILLGDNSYASGTTINEGTLQIGDGGTTGSITGDVANNAALVFNRSDDIDFSGMISGTGIVTKAGTGILTLVGDSSGFDGATSVAAGTLMVDGSLGGTVDIASGASLGGIGTVGGTATISSGGTLIGRQGETLSFGSDLVLASGATVDVSLGASGTTGLFDVAGNLTIDGQLHITDLGGFGPGLYRLFDYAGALTDNGLAIGTVPTGTSASDLLVQTSIAQQVNLVNTNGVTLNYWDGDDTSLHNNGVIDGGDGVWNLANANWTDSGGAFDAPWSNGGFAIFTGQAGTVTVDASLGALSVSGAQFATDGYRLQGGAITITLPETILRVGFGALAGASVTATIASEFTGSGGLEKTDFGTLILAGTNSYTGGTLVSEGTLQLGDGGASGSILGDVANNGIFAIDRSDSVTFAGTISGTGGFRQAGTGTTILTADNSYTGGTTIAAGALQIGDGGTTGSITGDVANNAALVFNRSDDLAFSGAINGTGSVTQAGAGTTILTGDSNYTGGTTITAGTLQIGDGGTTGSITGNIANNVALTFDRSDDLTFDGVISGAGTMTQAGSGILTLTGDSSGFGGSTMVAAGTLQVDGSLGGTVDVASGASLGGIGTVGGTATIVTGGTLIGRQGETLSFGSDLVLAGGAIVNVSLGAPGTTGLFNVAGNLTIDGQLDITDLGGFGPGLYRLFDYAGALTNNDLAIGTLPAGTAASDLLVQTSVAQQINLVNTSGVTLDYWDGDDTGLHNNGVVDGGDGVWNLANPNWTDSGGAFDAPWANGSFAIFTGQAGTVTVDASLGALSVGGAQFATDGYRIQGGAITLTLPETILRVGFGAPGGAGVTATIASALTGSGGLRKTDFGTLILTGANGYTGGTVIGEGTLQLGDGGTSGSILGDIVNNGIFAINRSDGFTFADTISGTGAFHQAGTGTTILTADNSYTGGTAIAAGVLQIGSGGTSGSIVGDVLNNAALVFNRSGTLALDDAISGTGTVTQAGTGTTVLTGDGSYTGGTIVTAGTLQIGDGGTTGSIIGDIANDAALVFNRSDDIGFSGMITGTGTVTQAGTGILTLTGDGSGFGGSTTVAAGTLMVDGSLGGTVDIASGASLGGIGTVGGTATISSGGTLIGRQGETLSFGSNLILADGAIVDISLGAPGTVGLFDVAGNLTIDGQLDISDLGGFGLGLYRLFDYAGALTDNGLAIGTVPAGTDASDLFVQTSIAQQVNLVNSTGVTLNCWDGDDTSLHNNDVIDGGDGVWNLANPNWTDSGGAFDAPWANGGFAIFTGRAGTVMVDASLGVPMISGAQFATSGYRIQGDAIALALPRTTLRVGFGSRSGASVTATLASELTGSGGLEKTDFGTLILTGTSSYTGGTFVSEGTLQLGDGGASGSILGDVANNGIFAIDRSDAFTFSGAISGTGGFRQVGSGTTILTADNSYTGGTTIAAGTVQIGSGGTTGSIVGDVLNNAALILNRSDDLAFGGAISGTGSVTQSGSGTTILTGDSSYTGGTTITAGTLQIGDGGTTGSITGSIANNAALVFDRSDALVFGGVITGTGTVTQAGAGTTILTGANSYTGGTTIAAGTLQLGDGGATGSITGDVANNGVLLLRRSNLYSFAGTISGAGSVVQAGTGTTVLTAANSYSGGTLIEGGTLSVGSDANLGAASGGLTFDGGTLLNTAAFTSTRAVTLANGGGTFQTDADLTLSGAATGSGELTKTGSGALILTGTNVYTGGTVIAAGTLQLGNGGAGGSITGDVANGGTLVFNRSDALSFAGEISGIGSLVQLGTGTSTLTGISSYTGMTRVEAGMLVLTAPTAIALSPVSIAAGATYALDFSGAPASILFENALSGAGLMRVDLGDPTSFLVFGSNAGSAFTGTVALERSSFDLAGDNTAALTNATLRLDAGNTTRVDIGTQAIGNLTLNGGTLIFPAELPSDALSPGIIQAGTLTFTSGVVGVTVPRPANIPGGVPAPNASLLQQDDTVTAWLVQASNVVGSASSLTLVDQNGSAVGQTDVDIAQNGDVVAIGSYGYNLTSGAANDGLYVAYGLSRLDLQAGQMLTLSGDDGTAAGSELHALVTGSGNLAIAAADTITLSNAANAYTGTTQVLSGTLALGTDHALGLTSLLAIESGATADIDGRTQAVGALDVRGTLALDGGNLSVANGGTSTGSLNGGGSLNLTGGTLAIQGANAQLSASVTIASGAAVMLTDVQGLGTGAIADAGMLTLDGASGTLANALSGAGGVALTNAASVTLGGNNSGFSGLFAIAQGTSLTASLPQHLGTAAIQDDGNLTLDTANDWTFANIVSGTGALTKAGSGTLIVTGTNSYTGGTTIAAGTLQLGDGGTTGTIVGDVVDNGMFAFDRSDAITFAGAISGSGSLAQRGTGTTILTGANSYVGATQVEAGTLVLAAPSAVAPGPVSIAAGAIYALDFSGGPTSFLFGNALTGSGLMRVDLGDAANIFAFGSSAGSAFAGTVALGRSSSALSGNNTTALANATLRLDAGNVTTVGAGTQAIGNLIFNGGTVVFPVALPPDTISSGLISTGTLTLTSGTVEASVPEQAPVTWNGIGPASTLLQQDDMIVAQLIAAQSVVGSASNLTLADSDASGVEEALVDIVQNGNVVAIGSYGYNLTTGLEDDGLYVAYGLSQLDLRPGQTLTLLGDDGTEAGSDLHALVTGSGNLAIAATDTITLGNTANDYTGTTRVTTGTLALGADRVLGLTSLLTVDAGATADISGMTQEVGALDVSGTLALNGGTLATSTMLGAGTLRTSTGGNVALAGGTLTIVNGGATAAGTLSGVGNLNLTGGTLSINGANAQLGASIAIAHGAAATLTNAQGLGTGPIADAGTLTFAGASGTFANALSGAGTVGLTNAASVTLGGNNSGFSGVFAIAQGTSLTASLPQHLGGSTVQDDGRLVIDTDTDWALASRVTGIGSLTKQGTGALTITTNETYSGGTIVSEGTLIVGTPTSTDATLSGGGDTYVASGATLGGYGRVHGTVTNEGTIAVRDALAHFTGQAKGAFTINSGLVNNALAQIAGDGIGNRLIVSNYVGGAGSIVAINTELGDDASPSDMLVIDGGTATGSSGLRVTNIGGAGALTTGDGIRVIDAINGATTAASAFGLASPVVAGPYEYSLYRGGLTAGENWYLRSALDCSLAPDSAPCLSTEEEEAPDYRREDSLYAALPSLTLLYGSELIATLHERSGMRAPLSSASGPAIWGRVVGGREKHDGDPLGIYGSGPGFNYDSVVYQAGIDYHRAEHDRLGVYFAYGRLGSNVDHYTGGFAGDARLKAYTIGHYWTHVGASGWYIDGVVQGTRYDLKASSHRGLADLETDGHGFAASLEGGYPIRLSSDWSLEPQAQIVFQKVSLDSANDGVSTVRFRDIRSLAGRIGLRLSHDFTVNPDAAEPGSGRGTWWLRADLWNEFENDPVTRFSSDDGPVDLDNDLGGLQLKLTTAVSAEVAKGIDLYAGGNVRYRLDGDSWGYQGSMGLKIAF
ncbi:MAG: autotransporter-associated beta strand repeat-containing protein [Sphingomonas sp.]|uniref:autotransporter-associated beta strand repeat-containing protein n=1 Tax=Sphingomonas sp. TaxID=28214 RepID=UPI0022739C1C|nr:autotransporter-associated beta strand repeat-containing protein [Sphingomonas sp.]MCX8475870.1 autotransporter-associated beta strand repeat-containing protein [Sphingomonas sp.]